MSASRANSRSHHCSNQHPVQGTQSRDENLAALWTVTPELGGARSPVRPMSMGYCPLSVLPTDTPLLRTRWLHESEAARDCAVRETGGQQSADARPGRRDDVGLRRKNPRRTTDHVGWIDLPISSVGSSFAPQGHARLIGYSSPSGAAGSPGACLHCWRRLLSIAGFPRCLSRPCAGP